MQGLLRGHGIVDDDIHIPRVYLVDGRLPHLDISEMFIEEGQVDRLEFVGQSVNATGFLSLRLPT